MQIVYADSHHAHRPKTFLVAGAPRPCPEVPERADCLCEAISAAGHVIVAPPDYGAAPRETVHTSQYLTFLETIHARWSLIAGASDEVLPNVHPVRRSAGYPDSAAGQAGYHMADMACPIGPDTWMAACAAANAATHAAELVLAAGAAAYALCRPPGHHAYSDMAGGFCYLNNTAIAAQHLRSRYERVAIIDVDLHHGNGTQGIFYRRADVLTISIHADPTGFYPFFWGYAGETGEAEGNGYNLNLPLARGSDDKPFLAAVSTALDRIRQFEPGALVVALGLDASKDDPFAGLAVSTAGFGEILHRLGALGLPTVLVQEGGYLCDSLGRNLVSALTGFEAGHAL